ncbi:tripartite AtP-independent periplasmic transporter subunit DctQ [Salinisphaera sp. S4-8]
MLETFSRLLFGLCALVIVAMALSVTYEVASRYFFGRPTIWVTELASYFLVAVTFLGAAWTLRNDGHIRMDLLRETGGRIGQLVSDLAMFSIAAVVAAALLWSGWHMTSANYAFGWRASTILATPLWLPQSLIPLGSLALLLQSVIGLWDTVSGARYRSE